MLDEGMRSAGMMVDPLGHMARPIEQYVGRKKTLASTNSRKGRNTDLENISITTGFVVR